MSDDSSSLHRERDDVSAGIGQCGKVASSGTKMPCVAAAGRLRDADSPACISPAVVRAQVAKRLVDIPPPNDSQRCAQPR